MKIKRLMAGSWALMAAVLCSFDTAQGQTNALTLSTTSLNFVLPTGATGNPAPQSVSVGVTTSPSSLGFTLSGASCIYYALTVSGVVATTTTPVNVTVAAQLLNSAPGTYPCDLLISGTGVQTAKVAIMGTVGSGTTSGTVTANPTTLSLSGQAGGGATTSTITLTNSNSAAPVAFTVAAAVSSGAAGWLSVTPTSGTVTSTSQITVQANPASLAANTYQGTITITPTGGTAITIPVTFTVSGTPAIQFLQNGQPVTQVNFYFQNGATAPAPQTVTVASTVASQPLGFVLDGGSTSNWLVATPMGSLTTPQAITLSTASTIQIGLVAGTYNGFIRATSAGASNSPAQIPVVLTVSNNPLLTQIGSAPSTFTYQTGGTVPANQTLQIGTTSTSLPLSLQINQPGGQTWLQASLSASQASGNAPATLTIGVNPAGLVGGTYTGSVTITSAGVPNTVTVPVTLVVSATNQLSAVPSQLNFTYQAGTILPQAQTVTVTSSGGPLDFTVNKTTTTCGQGWLNIGQTSGNTGTAGAPFTVSVNPSGITTSTVCTGSLTIGSTGASNTVTIPVSLQVSSGAIIQANPAAVALTGQVGSGLSNAVPLTLSSSDSTTPLAFTISSPATWLVVTPTTGNTPVNLQIRAETSDASLKLGVNTTTLTLTSPSLQAPIQIPVTLTLVSASNLTVSPTSLVFSQPVNGNAPAAQTVSLGLTGTGATGTFTAVASTNVGTWLTVTPTSGSVPGQISVSVSGANLSQGTYQGQVVVTVPGVGQSPFTIPVTLNVTAAQTLSVSASTLNFSTQVGAVQAPASQTVSVSSTGVALAYTVGTTFTSCPGFFSVTPTSGTTPSNVTVSINQSSVQAGTCAGTLTVTAGSLSATVAVNLAVAAAATPSLTSIVNGASFIPSAVAPGEIVTIFGTNVGPATLANYILTNNKFETKVADTEVLFDGVAAPIIFARTDQTAVVVPFEVAGRSVTNIQVRRLGVLSNTLAQRVVDTAPGIFTIGSTGAGQAAIINQNGTVNNANNPAPKGTAVAIYITGGGQTFPLGSTGGIWGSSPLSQISAPVQVTIGGSPATLAYAGGAPGAIQGLYQVNVTVPNVATPGGITAVPVQVTIGGSASQGGVTMFVQ